jgi:hypothetical protein
MCVARRGLPSAEYLKQLMLKGFQRAKPPSPTSNPVALVASRVMDS